MVNVVGEEIDNVMKTGTDGGVPAPVESAWRIPQELDAWIWKSGPQVAALRPEGAMRQHQVSRGDNGKTLGRSVELAATL